ncbi:MAG: ATP-binding cassette domain-containing protein [Candidatus Riflebacteria bacterium]|nr:ATP-binding cassette domain-containing protein [Candidatus Riflebacteria bacterium]
MNVDCPAGAGSPGGPWRVRIREFRFAPEEEPVLRDLDFPVEPGRVHQVCGPSGCGKSTLLAVLGGQLPAPGSRAVLAADLGGFPTAEARRSAQDPLLQIACATVIDELLLGPEYREETPERAVAVALGTLRDFGLADLAPRETSLLSFGQARLLGLAGLWQYPASVLLLDEPFVGLDARRQAGMRATIDRIAATGTAVLLTDTAHLPGERTIDLHPVGEEPVGPVPAFGVDAPSRDLVAAGLTWPGWEGGAGVGFSARPGGLVVVTGPNGAGKTRLLQHLAGLSAFPAGRVEVPGEVGYVPQNPDQEVFAADSLGEIMTGARGSEADARALAAFFGVADCLPRSPLRLSYGQKKRISLIGGLVRRTPCLLLDEPLSGLDRRNRARLLALLGAFLREGGLALVATHEPEAFASFRPARLHLDPAATADGSTWTEPPADPAGTGEHAVDGATAVPEGCVTEGQDGERVHPLASGGVDVSLGSSWRREGPSELVAVNPLASRGKGVPSRPQNRHGEASEQVSAGWREAGHEEKEAC